MLASGLEKEKVRMGGTLFGKPKSEVIRHPGAFKRAAEKAGKSTAEYAKEKEDAPGVLGKRARLAQTLMGMGK